MEPRTAELVIERLGARGDGIAHLNGTPVFVALALPGERVTARIEGKRGDGLTAVVEAWLEQAPDRAKPVCRHFGVCGGCSAQHMKDAVYAVWKRGIAVQALARIGVPEDRIAPLMRVPAHTRRRATFAFRKDRDGTVLGFNAAASSQIADLHECPLLRPELVAMLPAMRAGLNALFSDAAHGDLSLQATETGLDALIQCDIPLDLFKRERIAKLVAETGLARLAWQTSDGELPEPVAERMAPMIRLGGIEVNPPPGSFLQPSLEGEAAITAQVLAGLAGLKGPVADLYAGVGSFSLPLAAEHKVHAVEGNVQAAAALKRAAERAMLHGLSCEKRDLAKRPLQMAELDNYEGAVIDPPRAGAREQVMELALASKIERIVMVSCNPATMARDLAILLDGGWRLDSVVPIDQFLWTPHLEMTALLHQTIKKT